MRSLGGVIGVVALLSSCGGGMGGTTGTAGQGGTAGRGGAAGLMGAAGRGGAGGQAGSSVAPFACPPAGSLTAEPPLREVSLDGGISLDQLPRALAVARCNYYSRCFGLAAYLADQCVDIEAAGGVWSYRSLCTGDDSLCLTTSIRYAVNAPSAELLQAVNAGLVHYDPQREAQCIAAELAEGCADGAPIEALPACTDVFTCVSDSARDDAGTLCSALVAPKPPSVTCATDADCTGGGTTPGPYCVGGFCAPSACGFFDFCVTLAREGEPCNRTAPSLLYPYVPTPTGTCAPGLRCQGATSGDALDGTCVVPQDVGGPCTDGDGCRPGLACACGLCLIPPSTGACAAGQCNAGAAYCDFATNLCQPLRQMGAGCTDHPNGCAEGLMCGAAFTCDAVSPDS